MPLFDARLAPRARSSPCAGWRSLVALLCGLIGLGAAARAFWVLDLRYAQPTPVPAGRVDVEAGRVLELPANLERFVRAAPGPTLLHVFNPDCPCSRFNLDHVLSLARDFEGRARVVAILEGTDAERSRASFEARETGLACCVDPDGSIAAALGAYSTPQAVVVDRSLRLVWRGNYNASRFCRDRATEYARIALEHAVDHTPVPDLGEAATRAYGCALPSAEESAP